MGTITRTLANNVTTALGKAGGMTFITSATPSGSSSSIEMQSCFSATYQNYIVIFTALDINTNNSDMVFRMMSGSSEHTGGDYYWGIGTSNRAGTAVNETANANSSGRLFSNTSNDQDTINMWNLVTNPQVSGVKTCWASMGGDRYEGAANAHPQYGYTWINSGSQFDGFSFKSSSGHNFRNTGKIMVFGLSDS